MRKKLVFYLKLNVYHSYRKHVTILHLNRCYRTYNFRIYRYFTGKFNIYMETLLKPNHFYAKPLDKLFKIVLAFNIKKQYITFIMKILNQIVSINCSPVNHIINYKIDDYIICPGNLNSNSK
jgi:hypothetical protein